MHILVLNSGSSSLKFSIFACDPADADPEPQPILDGEVSGIGGAGAKLEQGDSTRDVQAATPAEAVHAVLDELAGPGIPAIDAVGYRVVHPGPKLDRHVRIDDQVLADLEAAVAFAPLHNPEAIALIRACMARFDHIPHYACFDTVFHQTMPKAATTYAIPLSFRDQGVRRYGFHGLSCESVMRQLDRAGIHHDRLIIAHLGSGCSVTATDQGKSVDNTMGLTPTGGVVMGSRPGDLDPGLIFYLLRQPGATIQSVEHMLNHDAGLKALGGTNDMRKLRAASSDDENAGLAIQVFTNSVRRGIGGMHALHGADAFILTGGIGEHDHAINSIVNGLGGAITDPTPTNQHGLRRISTENSAIPVYVVPAQEDLIIAVHVTRMSAAYAL